MKKILFFAFLSVLFASCSSILSIEKRKYMSGYHVEWYAKNKTFLPQSAQRIHREPQSEIDSVITSAETSAFSAVNSSNEKNILIEKPKSKIVQVIFRNDTLPKKSKDDLRKEKKELKKNKKISPYAFLSSLIFPSWFLSIIIAGLVYSDPIANFFFSSLLLFPLGGFILSFLGLNQIKKNSDKFKGKGFAIAGIIESSLLFALSLLAGYGVLMNPGYNLWFVFALGALILATIAFAFIKYYKKSEAGKKKNNIPLALLFLSADIITGILIFNYFIYPGLLGLLFWGGFIASIIFLIVSIRNHYVAKHGDVKHENAKQGNANQENADSDRKLSPKAIWAFILAILNICFSFGVLLGIAFATLGGTGAMIIFFGVFYLLTLILSYKNSVEAKKQIKEGKYWGNFFVIAARIILLLPFALILLTLIINFLF